MTTWSSLFSGSLPGAAPADIGKVLIVGAGPTWVASFLTTANVGGLGALATLNTVGPAQIDALAVTGPKLADGAVTTAKLLDGNVTAIKLAAGVALSNLGYTPANRAGDTFTGTVIAPAIGAGVAPTPGASVPLHARGTAETAIAVTSASSWAALDLQAAAGQPAYVFFKAGGVEQARIMGAGDLVFMTGTAATERLRIRASDGAVLAPGPMVAVSYQGTVGVFLLNGNAASSNLYFNTAANPIQAVFGYDVASKVLNYISNGAVNATFNPTGDLVVRGLFSGAGVSVSGAVWANYVQGLNLVASNAAGSERRVQFQTGATMRWYMGADAAAEGGANAGSNFFIARSNDAGTYMGSSISITRATGQVTVENNLIASDVYMRVYGDWLSNVVNSKGPALGYTPVTQGVAPGMGSNRVYMGWDNIGNVLVQVDGSPMGKVALQNNNNVLANNTSFTFVESGGYASGNAAITMQQRSLMLWSGAAGMGYVALAQSQAYAGTLILTPYNGNPPTIYFNMASSKVQAGQFELISDVRAKSNFNPIVGALDRLMTLPALSFDKAPYIDAAPDVPRQRTMGTLAQLVRAVFPDAVSQQVDGALMLNSDALVTALIEGLREVDTQVRVLRGLPPRPPPLTVEDALDMVTPEDAAMLVAERARAADYAAELEAKAAEPGPVMPEVTP